MATRVARWRPRILFLRTQTTAAVFSAFWIVLAASTMDAQPHGHSESPMFARGQLARKYFGSDAPWFLRNIPFLEIDDPEIQQIYYYRWKLYRSHIRDIGPQGTTVTEFLDNVSWARQPDSDLNDSASFHLSEGRWLRDPTVIDSLIDHLYSGGANDRHFSESIAAATFETTLVTGDPAPAIRHLDTMQYIFNQWSDHFDRARNLYWIDPISDATEYTISSIDASGAGFVDHPSTDPASNGFTKGFAFRPSINSYQYANALAIAEIASKAGKPDIAADYTRRAEAIRSAVLTQLWNPTLQHFTDRYQRSTRYVTAGDFVRGRELVGYVPWLYELPPRDSPSSEEYAKAWQHVLSATELVGPFGLRTVELSYPRYLVQYRYDRPSGHPECQWNGPSWPFQTSQTLTGLANLLNDYSQTVITRADYIRLLRQYTHQHFLSPGHPDLQEDYNPETGAPIVGLARSHHYNHSTYIDLVLSGLVGIRPRADNVLEVNPLLPTESQPDTQQIHYFAVRDVVYHGHQVSVLYDQDGKRYGLGRGLSVFVDGERAAGPSPLGRMEVNLPRPPTRTTHLRKPVPVDLAVNVGLPTFPVASASSTASPESMAEAIDGRLWFFPEILNGWSPAKATGGDTSWYAVDFGQRRKIATIDLYFFDDGQLYKVPVGFTVQYMTKESWRDVGGQCHEPRQPIGNGLNRVSFPALESTGVRIVFQGPSEPMTLRLIEVEAFSP